MNNSAKQILALIAAAALTSVCFSCGTQIETSDTTASDTTGISPAETELSDNLPDTNLDGYSFRILAADNDIPMLYVEDMNGSLVNDAVYKANTAVEERFNIELEWIKLDKWDNSSMIKSMILSGSDDFDVGVCHDKTAGNLSMENLFVNLRELPYLDFGKPWWPEFTVDGLTVNGKIYLFSNYIGYNGLRGTKNMYVNLDRLEDYQLESPYELVRSGKWTLDKVISITKEIYEDLNGDSNYDRDDFYGFAFTGLFYGWLENFGIEAYTHNSTDTAVELTINSDRTAELVAKLKGWLYGQNPGVYYKSSHTGLYNPDSYPVMFADGKCLFTYGSLYVLIDNLADSKVTYGILPMPKYDENQEGYYGVCYDSPMWVPVTVSDPERTGLIIEAMSFEGYKTILPAYKDIALKNRYATDSDSAEMLDIIFENRVLSFSYIYGNDGFQGILNKLIPSDTLEFASYYAANESVELDRVAKINSFFS